jgi:DNA repair exonuclease SbcCD ATPase subunit
MLVEVGIKQSNYQSKLKEIKDEVATLQNIESLIGKSCEACAREFTKDYINQLAEHKKKSINSKMETVEKLEQEKKVAENIVEKEKSKISQSEKILEAVQSHLAHGEELLFTLRKTLSELQSLLKMKENYVKYRQNEQYGKVEEYEKQINDELSKLNDIKKKLTVLNENINKLDDDIVTLKQLERIFGGQGLRVMLLNNITPELNKIVNEYLSILDDITVEISTTKRLKSGEYRDKFEIIVNNLIGSKEIKGNSSGEQQKVNLAIALGFNKLIRSLTSASVNFIFLDEPLESLDAGSSERAIELLREFAKDISNVFIISHVADIQELADNEIVFVKRNGFTEIHV